MNEKVSRAERFAEIRRLREDEGLVFREIAKRLGLGLSTVQAYYTDPDGSRAAARKAKNDGTCADCGGPTKSGGAKIPPARCWICSRERQRTDMEYRYRMSDLNRGRLVWTDAAILEAVRGVAIDGVVSLDAYKEAYAIAPRGSMPSSATVVHRFGYWRAAVHAAGLRTKPGWKGGPYASRMPNEGLVLAVQECADDLGHLPTANEYEEWAIFNSAPSEELIRIRFGSWMAALELAAVEEAAV